MEKPVVNSWTEFGSLEYVCVGSALGCCYPAKDPVYTFNIFNDAQVEKYVEFPMGPRPEHRILKAEAELAHLVGILEGEVITVGTTTQVDEDINRELLRKKSTVSPTSAAEDSRVVHKKRIETFRPPSGLRFDHLLMTPWFKNYYQFGVTCPRDTVITLGNTILEAPTASRVRYFESAFYRPWIYSWWEKDSRIQWKTAPQPTCRDGLYDKYRRTQNHSSDVGNTREYPSDVGNTREYLSEVGNTREYSSDVGNTREYPSAVENTRDYPSDVGNTREYLSDVRNTREYPSDVGNTRKYSSDVGNTQKYPSDVGFARPRLNESEVAFDAADLIRVGKDVFYKKAATANNKGIQWLRREFPNLRFHMMHFPGDMSPHLDVDLVPLRPPTAGSSGIVLISRLSPPLKAEMKIFEENDWKPIFCPLPASSETSLVAMCSAALNLNLLSLSHSSCVVEECEVELFHLLEDLGLDVITCPLRTLNEFGGGLHCVTWDVRRDDTCQDFFPNQDYDEECANGFTSLDDIEQSLLYELKRL